MPVHLTNFLVFTLLALYPSNKLEHLSYLLSELLARQPGPVFKPETILVESPGMQHYVNMAMAREKGIAMNLHFPLPVRFMWDTARALLGEEAVPRQSPYRREVLVWRIDKILSSGVFCAHPDAMQVCQFWQQHTYTDEQSLQRLQLATAIADTFEQYLLYRPDWLFAWEENQQLDELGGHAVWQALLWRELVSEAPLHPARLHQRTLQKLKAGDGLSHLPERIIVFGINTMAPQLVAFFDALAAHIDIHIFHLNPSLNYWGDAASDKERAKRLREGIARYQQDEQGNPLLGNLGQQGRDLFNLLTSLDTFEVSAFDAESPGDSDAPVQLLQAVQYDILQASAPRPLGALNDSTIKVVSAHSGLREVQALHDHLLDLMNSDTAVSPSDIVVMCPAIEHYAPFIDSVFHRLGTPQPNTTEPPRIPCSIADRSPLDAEPLIAAFISLLSLPDSRFEISQILDYLRLEAVQKKFAFNRDDLELMTFWLQQAHVHWGLNAAHKARVSDGATELNIYSWAWGLKRLLVGMACEDTDVIVGDVLTVPHVEGQNSVLLGKLIDLVALLGEFASAMATPRVPEQWHRFLMTLRDRCFEPTNDNINAWESLSRTTADLVSQCDEAGYESELTLLQTKDILLKRFSSPDAGNHFMTGQVTFCSMLPMRSIPFKHVCILGLNDGEFPRQSTISSLNLMEQSPRRRGDRSRRLEDRYLFLEAILSAREGLYLSYQGKSAQDNSHRQPSLILDELLDVLQSGYDLKRDNIISHTPLHPFSPANFTGVKPSFEAGWCRLSSSLTTAPDTASVNVDALSTEQLPKYWHCSDFARVLASPLKAFANQQLRLYLEQQTQPVADAEPFSDSPLLRYQAIDQITDALYRQIPAEDAMQKLILSGDMPATPLADLLKDQWVLASTALNEAMGLREAHTHDAEWGGEVLNLSASAWASADAIKLMHSGSQNARRLTEQFLTMLVFNSAGNPLPLKTYFLKWQKGEATVRCATFSPYSAIDAHTLLLRYEQALLTALSVPTPCYAQAGIDLEKARKGEPPQDWYPSYDAAQKWSAIEEGNVTMQNGLIHDPYYTWFFPQGVTLSDMPTDLFHQVFGPLVEAHKESRA